MASKAQPQQTPLLQLLHPRHPVPFIATRAASPGCVLDDPGKKVNTLSTRLFDWFEDVRSTGWSASARRGW